MNYDKDVIHYMNRNQWSVTYALTIPKANASGYAKKTNRISQRIENKGFLRAMFLLIEVFVV